MADYIKGLGGCGYCQDCDVDDPCALTDPVVGTHTYSATRGTSMFFGGWGTNSPTSRSISGTLPAGVSFSGGSISGTPTAVGVYVIDLTATNACGIGVGTLTITVVCEDCTTLPACSTDFAGEAHMGETASTFYDISCETCYLNSLTLDAYYDIDVTAGSRLQIFADSVEIYDSGCFASTLTGVVLGAIIPACTTEIEVRATGAYCNSSTDGGFTYYITVI